MAPSRGRGPQRKGQIRQALVPVVLLLALTYLGVRSYTSAEQARGLEEQLRFARRALLAGDTMALQMGLNVSVASPPPPPSPPPPSPPPPPPSPPPPLVVCDCPPGKEGAVSASVAPPIAPVSAFRKGLVDWHDLELADEQRVKDRDPNQPVRGLSEFLLGAGGRWMRSNGRASVYGLDHGPLQAFAMCGLVQDPCMVHDEGECDVNQLCGWCSSRQLCVDALNPRMHRSRDLSCPEWPEQQGWEPQLPAKARGRPQQGTGRGVSPQAVCQPGASVRAFSGKTAQGGFDLIPLDKAADRCDRLITQPVAWASPPDTAQQMWSHWFPDHYAMFYTKNSKADGFRRMASHIVVGNLQREVPTMYDTYGFLTKFCWRRRKDIHGTVCVCDPSLEAEHATPSFEDVEQPAASWREQSLRTLGLWPEPPVTQHRIGIVSRMNKRFLLNEEDLESAVNAAGVPAQRLPFEMMTLYELVSAMQSTTVLIGAHGAGLCNAAWMRLGRLQVVELLAHHVFMSAHPGPALLRVVGSDAVWHTWNNRDRNHTVAHFHLWEEMAASSVNVAAGQSAKDTVVDVEQFLTLVSTALAETALGSPKTPNSLPPPGNWAQLQLKGNEEQIAAAQAASRQKARFVAQQAAQQAALAAQQVAQAQRSAPTVVVEQ